MIAFRADDASVPFAMDDWHATAESTRLRVESVAENAVERR